jgi:AraC-like DNA-binding protein
MMDFNSLLLPFNYLNELPGFHALFDIEPKLRENHKFKSRLRITEEQIATVNVFLHRIRSEMDAKNTGYKAVVTGVLVELLVFLSRSYFNCDISKSVLEVSRLGMIITKIKTDFDSNITLDTLALMANMSKWTFLRSFKKVFDMTPIQYLMNIRIAKKLRE